MSRPLASPPPVNRSGVRCPLPGTGCRPTVVPSPPRDSPIPENFRRGPSKGSRRWTTGDLWRQWYTKDQDTERDRDPP